MHQSSSNDQYVDLRKVLAAVRQRWYYYVIAQVLFIACAFILGKVIAPVYEVGSSIYIKENGSLQSQKAMEFMQSFQLFDQKRTFQNEMLILKSTPLIEEVVDRLDLEIQYYKKKGVLNQEIYNDAPFVVTYDSLHLQVVDVPFTIRFQEDGKFRIQGEADDLKLMDFTINKGRKTSNSLLMDTVCFQSAVIENKYCRFQVYLKDPKDLPLIAGQKYQFEFKDKNKLVYQLQETLNVQPENPEVSVVTMSMKSNSVSKATEFLTTLTNLYLQRNLERKNHFAQNTIHYINEQLAEISDSLSIAESRLENFRTGNQVIDISSKAGRIFERLQQLELEKSTIDRQYKYYQYLDEFFEENDNLADLVVPSSMGITDQTLNGLIRDLIQLVNQRSELLGKRQAKSPFLRNLEVQIESLKRPIVENINFSISTLQRTLNDLNKKISAAKKNIELLPKTERQLVGFERKFQLNDAIYTFLLQRRAEAQIAKASNLPEHEIVEPSRLVSKVYPNNTINYGFAIFMGFLVPSILILLIGFFDVRIKGEQSLLAFDEVPFLGAIIKNDRAFEDVVIKDPTAPISETFRTIRTNLFFYLKGESNKTILVTSSVAGEGKSFVSLNLALSLAQLGKKVVLVGFDLRKSDQFRNLVKQHDVGLTSLYVQSQTLNEIIQTTDYDNIDVITPGIVPPNPLELISNEITADIFKELRTKYDFIVVDSSPVGVVSDAYLLMAHSDVNLFVIRENYSHQPVVNSVLKEIRDKKVEKVGMVLNASRMEGKRYRYEYYNNVQTAGK